MKGTSCGMFAKTTSLAQPIPSRSAVRAAASRTVRAMSATASMLIPAAVEATFTEEQRRAVRASASGIASIRARSPRENPFSTRAEKPPRKSQRSSSGDLVEPRGDRDHPLRGEAARGDRDRADREALVHDRDAVAQPDLVADLDEAAREALELGAHALEEAAGVVARAVEEADAEGHGAHVEVLAAQHLERGEDLPLAQHRLIPGGPARRSRGAGGSRPGRAPPPARAARRGRPRRPPPRGGRPRRR